jgi:peptidoglycan hydrolase-like protein with peptidoglycan-binding domain
VPDTDVAAHLRRGQAAYLADPSKGFSYGYNFVIGPNPIKWDTKVVAMDVWEVRGLDIQNAANNGDFPPYSLLHNTYPYKNFNGYTVSIQIMSSESHPATADQQLQFRYMMAYLDSIYVETLRLQPHRMSDYTSCPGDFLNSIIAKLAIRPLPPPPVNPAPNPDNMTTPVGTPTMKLGDTNASTIIFGVANDGRVSWLQCVMRVTMTGVYDKELEASVKAFQHNVGLPETGEYNAATETKLRAYRGK